MVKTKSRVLPLWLTAPWAPSSYPTTCIVAPSMGLNSDHCTCQTGSWRGPKELGMWYAYNNIWHIGTPGWALPDVVVLVLLLVFSMCFPWPLSHLPSLQQQAGSWRTMKSLARTGACSFLSLPSEVGAPWSNACLSEPGLLILEDFWTFLLFSIPASLASAHRTVNSRH